MYLATFSNVKVFLVLFAGVFGISTAAIFVKLSTEATGLDGIGFNLFLAASRLIISSVIMFPLWKKLTKEQFKLKTLKYCILAGICLACHYVTWFLSLAYTSVAASTAIVTTCPIWLVLISRYFFKEKLSFWTIFGIIISMIGGLIIACDGIQLNILSTNLLLGDFLALVSSWVYSLYFLFGREAQRKGLTTNVYALITYSTAALVLSPLPYFFKISYIGHPTIVYFYLVLMAIFAQIIGQTSLNLSLRWISPITVTLAVMFEPMFAGVFAYIFFGEVPSIILLIGVIVLLFGVGFTTISLRKQTE